MVSRIVTHNGNMHADEVVAAAIVMMVYPSAELVRTRDAAVLKDALADDGTLLLDVGGVFDVSRGAFDHHQPEGAGNRPFRAGRLPVEIPLWPYATAGLIWRHFGDKVVASRFPDASDEVIRELVSYMDESLIRFVDAIDCGVSIRSAAGGLSAIISSFNPSWFESPDTDSAFELVMNLAQVVIERHLIRQAGKILARASVRHASRSHNGRVLHLETCVPWAQVVSQELLDVAVVVYPTQHGWQAQCAADSGTLQPRMAYPVSWAGLSGDALRKCSGVKDAVFCHRSRHLVGAETKEGVMLLVSRAFDLASKTQLVA